ncbi:GNAT family N-acetyltransferase [Lysinibacillus sphaericus]|uniref:GNAT family N-acetyltransferase n=1 Tax=Lysinibacillus sphaericus TaxID=1421 RepID=A0A544V0J1_LYSSH|nr:MULTISPECIES: GNAT family N-acetyltransferase [unclassified Lysinibacillus]MDD1503143.1 GNAT family N-acetyltransferase [Lysinibacillus sp. CNPSo 3705]TQR39622.1 GNAT family N-acetyltransferase [Lysinibacillus sp. SDF0037]
MTENIKIRVASQEDAEALLEIQKEVLAEETYLITTIDEFQRTVDEQREWIQAKITNERETIFIAQYQGKIVGWLVFQSPQRKRLAHTGTFGMMVLNKYRGLGIGKRLIEKLLEWAEHNPYIEKISLGVFSTNERAIALYKKMGFVEEGRKINEIKLQDNEYIDDILMYKIVVKI